MTFKLLGLLALRHWLNSSFIAFKNEYNCLLHLLVVFFQVLNVPWSWKPLSIYGLSVITALSGVMDDLVQSFPCEAKFPLDRVFGRWGDFAQDKVPYVKSSEFHSLVVVFNHLLLVLRHLVRSSISDLIQEVQVDFQLIIVALLVEHLSSDVGYSYLDWDHYLGAISESEGGFSCWGSCCSPVSLQDIGQFFWPGPLCVVQLGFDNLK